MRNGRSLNPLISTRVTSLSIEQFPQPSVTREFLTVADVTTRVNKRHECRMKVIAMLDASISISRGVSSFPLFDEVLYVSSVTSQKMNSANGQLAACDDAEVDPTQKFSFPAGSGHWNVVLPVHAVASRGFEIPGIKLGLKPGKCEFEMLPPDVRGPDLPSA
ncbi:hypothetical protein ALC56_04190 [Trachymyrmex septentrionalis]|uniref:Uncharacterized protein n=1 Tax=Trachymyrmex septentrionalis TaxID=34720 RepID=A0A195FLA2_9HYME|nr:hypothetical protein ALC56_04190 [Trachymyrmex septentrionalis]